MPVNVRFAPLKVSQAGSGLPLSSDAVWVSTSPSTSSNALAGTWKIHSAFDGEVWSAMPLATTGSSFTAPMFTVTVSVSVTPPDSTVYWNVSTPLKSSFGV